MTAVVTHPLRVSATNVLGLGATVLAGSLLPALERTPGLEVTHLYLPAKGTISDYVRVGPGTVSSYRRLLPKFISRILECTVLSYRFNGTAPLLVLGDLPLRMLSPQIVFVQSTHMVERSATNGLIDGARYWLAQRIFRFNLDRVSAFIVQSDAMRDKLLAKCPVAAGRIHVIPQPPPGWLLDSGLHRDGPRSANGRPLRLFYPAADYPHKNHGVLASLETEPGIAKLVDKIVLTIPQAEIAGPAGLIEYAGRLRSSDVLAQYRDCDALLFLSKAESYGFPLVEAMWVGLPIVCPDLDYAHSLCGEQAIYFDPDDAGSLKSALQTLRERLDAGWWPDWKDRLSRIPGDWASVAARILKIVQRPGSEVLQDAVDMPVRQLEWQ